MSKSMKQLKQELETDYKVEPNPSITTYIRDMYFKAFGTYDKDIYIKSWWDSLENNTEPTTRGDGGSTSYYTLPANATELGHLIRHKNMSHAIGEAFCALYRLDDNGERKRNLTKAKYYIEQELLYS